ncbi:MAG TPA: macro domain-containing protein [Candidatus Limnocylindrales bacterium]
MSSLTVGGRTIGTVRGDITRVRADALVNAANEALAGGGGVDGAIHRAGGPAIMADLVARYGRNRRCPTGQAVLSIAGDLPADWVVHAVGPVWFGGRSGEPSLLASAYRSAFRVAGDAGARTVAAAAISTGIFGYPLAEAATVAVAAALEQFAGPTTIDRIDFVLFSEESLEAFDHALLRARRA